MARESSADGKKPKKDTKENAKKNARTRFIATLVTWILLNLIWLQASQAVAVNEINKHGRDDFDGHYILDVPNMLKTDREIPVDLSCDFKKNSTDSPVVLVRIEHELPSGETSLIWEGDSTDDCPDYALSLSPGKHVFKTTVSFANDSNAWTHLSAEMELGMHIWEPLRFEGFIVANALGLLLGIADRAIRNIIRRRRDASIRNMPLHKLRQKEDWEQIAHSMSGGDAVEVGDLVGFIEQEADDSAEVQRRRMREKFAAQSSETVDEDDDLIDDEAIDQDDELGQGTTEGLTGEVEEDRNIRTVGDLWRKLSGNESDKKRKR